MLPPVAQTGAAAVSLTLPVREAPYESAGLHPFFEQGMAIIAIDRASAVMAATV